MCVLRRANRAVPGRLPPRLLRPLALVVAGLAEVPDWDAEVDFRWGAALAQADRAGAGAVMVAEYLLPARSMRWVSRLIGPVLGRLMGRLMFAGFDCPPEDILVEAQAEKAFNSRAVLPLIQAPVLLICGDRDRFTPRDAAEETAKLIPGCTLIWYQGQGHSGAASNKRVAPDILAFVNRS